MIAILKLSPVDISVDGDGTRQKRQVSKMISSFQSARSIKQQRKKLIQQQKRSANPSESPYPHGIWTGDFGIVTSAAFESAGLILYLLRFASAWQKLKDLCSGQKAKFQ